MGATSALIGMSYLPFYFSSKVNLCILLGPASRLKNIKEPGFIKFAKYLQLFELLYVDILGEYQAYGPNWIDQIKAALEDQDHPEEFLEGLKMFDSVPTIDNQKRIKTFCTHMPSGTGWRNVVHYGQLINSEGFVRYDWGEENNMQIYGEPTPPDYPLNNIEGVPIAVLAGTADVLTDKVDQDWLVEQLGDKVHFYKAYQDFGHLTYVIADDMSYFHNDVLPLIAKYQDFSSSNDVQFLS